ncbi:MAG: hypothetical protein J2P48_13635 [Alphaproteobacteria bacterium]|nr:hypothetical protein [Alphaproteobacteria bacterium]
MQSVIEDLDLPNPVIRSHDGHGFAKQYVRDGRTLRTEPATNNVCDYGVNKGVENLPQFRDTMSAIIDNYHNVQQDVLETFIDRGQLRKLAEPSVLRNGRRIPGLKLDHPRQLAVMHALVRFANAAAGGQFTTADLYAPALEAPGKTAAWLRFATTPRSYAPKDWSQGLRDLRRLPQAVQKIYAPLTAGLLAPFSGDRVLPKEKRCGLDRLYERVCDDLDALLGGVGLKLAE